ncbi:MAG: helix-turn-helix domain-containing protein [Bryobacteraceae bacterium]
MKEKFDRLDGLAAELLGKVKMEDAVELLERSMIQLALEQSENNQSAASRQLGIHRNTLQRKMVEYGMGGGRARARRKPVSREGRAQRALRRGKTGAA